MRRGALSSTLAILLTLSLVDVAGAADKTFTQSFGEWLKDENLDPPGVPELTDDVTMAHGADLLDDTCTQAGGSGLSLDSRFRGNDEFGPHRRIIGQSR